MMLNQIIAEELSVHELIEIAQAMRRASRMIQIVYDPLREEFMVTVYDGDNGLNFERQGVGIHAKLPVAHLMAMNQLAGNVR